MIKMVEKHLLAVDMKTEEEIIEVEKRRQLATSDIIYKKKNF